MFRSALVLARKDLKGFVRDRAALVTSILVPIMLVSVFGAIMTYAFGGGSGGGMPKISLHVLDADQTDASERFVKQLSSLDLVKVRTLASEQTDPEESRARLEKMIRDGDAHHILVVPAGYSGAVDSSETPDLVMLRDPGRMMEDRIVQLCVMQAVLAEADSTYWFDATETLLREGGMGDSEVIPIRGWMDSIGGVIEGFAESQQDGDAEVKSEAQDSEAQDSEAQDSEAQDSETRSEGNSEADAADGRGAEQEKESTVEEPEGGLGAEQLFEMVSKVVPVEQIDVKPPKRSQQVTFQQAQSVAGMSVMMLLFALTSCGSVLLTEREDGTLRRLFVQPIDRKSILLGKFFFVFAIGSLQLAILFAYGEAVFRVGLFNDPVTLIVLSLSWVAAGGAFGVCIASACKSTKQAEGLSTLLILMMAALGGCWFPLQMLDLPLLLDTACKSTMTYWAMTGFQAMLWNQLPWYSSKILTALAWQWGWTIGLSVLSAYFFRRNYLRG